MGWAFAPLRLDPLPFDSPPLSASQPHPYKPRRLAALKAKERRCCLDTSVEIHVPSRKIASPRSSASSPPRAPHRPTLELRVIVRRSREGTPRAAAAVTLSPVRVSSRSTAPRIECVQLCGIQALSCATQNSRRRKCIRPPPRQAPNLTSQSARIQLTPVIQLELNFCSPQYEPE